MDKLKLLQLKNVEITGSYKNFPKLRWLCWHGCNLKTIPSGLLMNTLVVIDMSYGNLEKFEPPTVLNLLKILNLKGSDKLVSIHKLDRVPNLEVLILWDCSRLTHVCKTIGGLKSLLVLDFTGCKSLWKVSSNTTCVNRLEGIITLCRGRGNLKRLPISLPSSLEFFFLNNCNFEDSDYVVPVNFSDQPLYYMNLGRNSFLPNNIDFGMLRVLELTSCQNLKSLLCLPSSLEKLYTYSCRSLEKITFESDRFRLQEFGCEGCPRLTEVQGLFKLESIQEMNEADLGHLKWIKEYEDRMIDLVCDGITNRGADRIKMLEEYGIMSIFLQSVEDEKMLSEYMSESSFLSFCVPLCPDKHRIQGLDVYSVYGTSSLDDQNNDTLFVKISNKTKGLIWIYNPTIYAKIKVGEDINWLSYWPIGNMLETGDDIDVSLIVAGGLVVNGCGVSIVYTDCELEQEKHEENDIGPLEVVGGDLSEFELSQGLYYLCRRDFVRTLPVPDWFKMVVDDAIIYPDLHGWRKHCHLRLKDSFKELITFRGDDINVMALLLYMLANLSRMI